MNWKKIARCVRDHVWGPVGSVVFHSLMLIAVIVWSGHSAEREPPWAQPPVQLVRPPENNVSLDRPIEIERHRPDAFRDPVENDPLVSPVPDNETPPFVDREFNAAGESQGEGINVAFAKSPAEIDLGALDIGGALGDRIKQIGIALGKGPHGLAGANAPGTAWAAEKHIQRALVWLRNHQNDDGSWGPNKIAMTGLALLAFLGHGETSGSKEFGGTVRRAIDYLAEHQQADGLFSLSAKPGQPTVYEHAIATYAISEAYGMTRRPDLKERMESAAAIIARGQQPGGLWDYEFKAGSRSDTSVSGWQVQALKAAHVNGADLPGLASAIAKSAEGLRRMQAGDTGRFGYTQAGQGGVSMTGVGSLCLELSGLAKDRATRAGLLALRDVDCNWQRPEKWPMYSWYYITQALYHEQGAAWDSWSRKLLREFARNQNEDGSWASPADNNYENEETKHGLVYSTTLATLSLEAPLRFAPVSQSMIREKAKPEQRRGDEIVVELI